jgi:hypothetical protein
MKVGSEIEIAGVTYTVTKVGKWECVVEAADGAKRFPRTPAIRRLVAENVSVAEPNASPKD